MPKTRSRPSRKGPTVAAVWEPLERRASLEGDTAGLADRYGIRPPDEIWGSALFTCIVRYGELESGGNSGREGILWLSVHRRDRKPIRDWRHMQAIKNDVAGRERTAVEIYPAESELVDTSNEYHLWVLPLGFALPFGFSGGGLVMTPEELAQANRDDADLGADKAVQRPWQPGISTGPDYERPARDALAFMDAQRRRHAAI